MRLTCENGEQPRRWVTPTGSVRGRSGVLRVRRPRFFGHLPPATAASQVSFSLEAFRNLSSLLSAAALGASSSTTHRRMLELGIERKKLHFSMPRETTIDSLVYEEHERRGVTFVNSRLSMASGWWMRSYSVRGS